MSAGAAWGQAIGAVIGAVHSRRATNKANRQHIKMRQMAQHQFDEQMDRAIQRRVKDATAAGIHPLFALGASVGASPTISASSAPAQPTGSGVGDALQSIGALIGATIDEKRKAGMADEAEANYKNALAKNIEHRFASQGRDKIGAPNAPQGVPLIEGATGPGNFEVVPPLVESAVPGRPDVRSGPIPASVQIQTDQGVVTVPNPEIPMDELTSPVTMEYGREYATRWITNRMYEMRDALRALSSPSDREVRRLEAQLRVLKMDPRFVNKEMKRWYDAARRKLARLTRR